MPSASQPRVYVLSLILAVVSVSFVTVCEDETLIVETMSSVFSIEQISIEMILIAFSLIVMGIILYIVDKKSKSEVEYKNITLKQFILNEYFPVLFQYSLLLEAFQSLV